MNERSMLRKILSKLYAAGFRVVAADDGGDEQLTYSDRDDYDATLTEVLDDTFGVDEIRLYLSRPNFTRRHWLYVVLGNASDGSEVVCDYSAPRNDADVNGRDFDDVMTRVYLV